ncbi:MAG: ATP synthase F1 subunit gamma [Opitutales bacterium]|nr:ATP synthase F1 subunit gamma [Opitutales bacterium]MCH8541661.1 ATP synthase F1 subunit gamma [Opitutales bacterium]
MSSSTRDIRRRIKSVKNTKQITKAMEMVAASKMKKAQNEALSGSEYSALLSAMLAAIEDKVEGKFVHPFLQGRKVETRGILVLSSDKGLCGPLNGNLFKKISEIKSAAEYYVVGRKGAQFLSRTHRNLIADFSLGDKVAYTEVRQISQLLIDRFIEGRIDTIEILYPRFVNTLLQEPTVYSLLPLTDLKNILSDVTGRKVGGKVVGARELPKEDRDMIFEPTPYEVLSELLPRFIHNQVYQFVLDSKASEHSARMVAMKAASDNASSLLDDLTLQYNKARQAAITQEILEISAASLSN